MIISYMMNSKEQSMLACLKSIIIGSFILFSYKIYSSDKNCDQIPVCITKCNTNQLYQKYKNNKAITESSKNSGYSYACGVYFRYLNSDFDNIDVLQKLHRQGKTGQRYTSWVSKNEAYETKENFIKRGACR
jgi:hypothetical protein